MRIFIAGATGTLGRPVVRSLVANGHEVIGLSRSDDGVRRLETAGARGVAGNALDSAQMQAIITAARPDVLVHLLTALPPGGVMRKAHLQPTNDLRVTGTANLIAAARAAGVRRLVAESFIGVYGAARFTHPVTEDAPLPPVKRGAFADAVLAMRSLETQIRDAHDRAGMETVSLRIGFLYGPDVPSTTGMIAQARAGRLFVPPQRDGVKPFVHIHDAGTAIVAAIEHTAIASLVCNIADDQPISMETFMTLLAGAVHAGPPRHLPGWVVKLTAPVIAEILDANLPLSNAKAKRELGWTLRYPTVRDGLPTLSSTATA